MCALLLVLSFGAQAGVLDAFDNTNGWQATHTDDVTASLRTVPGKSGQALCLDYDFNGVSGAASTAMPPPWSVTKSRAMARPSPVPPKRRVEPPSA